MWGHSVKSRIRRSRHDIPDMMDLSERGAQMATTPEQERIDEAEQAQERDLERMRRFEEEMRRRSE